LRSQLQIKKYSGSSLKEASDKMKMELGDEAIILSSRLLENLPGKKIYEITAGIENPYTNENIKKINISDSTVKRNINKELSDKLLMAKKYSEPQTEPESKLILSQTDNLKKLVELLFNHELNKKIVTTVVNELKKYKEFLHSSNIDNYVLSSLSSLVPIHKFSFSHSNKPLVVALIGPTGVGKTTCVAKLAAISKIIHNLDVGLISTDTYRLGAIDQLKIFSEISNIDMLVAYEPEDMSKAYESFRKKNIIFIDTAGRSQKNSEQLAKTNEFLKAINVDEAYLVMSATSGTRTLNDIAERFKPLNPKAAIFTKLDEAAAFGNIINIASGHNLPVVYLSNGQVIPDDIIAANADFIANITYRGRLTT
jgi:flagellar biosynthesis protein FlhF